MKKVISVFITIIIIASSLGICAGAMDYADNFPNTHRNTGHNLADFIAVAKTQIGYTELSTKTGKPLVPGQDGGYTKYGAWFGMPTVAWCAFFVVWCSNQAGIPASVIPRMGNCAALANWFGERGRYFKRGELYPRTGDLIFYNWAGGSNQKHIGIVTGVSNGYVYTVEGNTGSKQGYRAEAKSRPVNAGYIIGYARPDYNDAETFVGSFSFAQYAAQKYKFASSRSGSVSGGEYRRTSSLAVITSSATEVSAADAVLHGRVENQSSYPVTSAGFYFGENKSALKKYKTNGSSSKNVIELECDIAGCAGELEMLKTYYYRAYAVLNGTTYQGPVYSVTTVDDRPQMLVLSETDISMTPGETYELLYAVLPLEAKDDGIYWSVSDSDILDVENGSIKAKSTGSASVVAVANYGGVSSSCFVNVTLPEITNLRSENISETEIKLYWDKDDSPEAAGYEIYRSEMPDDDYTMIKMLGRDESEFTDSTAQAGKVYYYTVRTIGTAEEYDAPMSAPLRQKALPAVPKICNITQNGGAVQLEISGGESVSYTVYRSTDELGGYSPVGKTAGRYFFDSDVVPGEKYYYRIASNGRASQSKLSEPFVKKVEKSSDMVDDFIINMLFAQKPLVKQDISNPAICRTSENDARSRIFDPKLYKNTAKSKIG